MALLTPTLPDFDLVLPDHPDYDDARRAWNLAADQRPAAVARPRDAAEVAAAVRYARERGLRVTAQATGHGAMALGGLEDTLLVRTDRMRGVAIDAPDRIARVEAGAQWQDVIDPAAEHGLACLHGSAPDVGVVGYTLGGGTSFYGRRYGTAASRLLAAELVLADGELVRADRRRHRDLFAALRGGGGGAFGIVTALEFELFAPGPVQAGHLHFPLERAREVAQAWACWAPCLPETATSLVRLVRAPGGGPMLTMVETVVLGDEEEADALLAPMRALGPVQDTMRPTPLDELKHLHMDPPGPVPATCRGITIPALPEAAVDAIVDHFGPALVGIQVMHAGARLTGLGDPFQVFAVGIGAHADLDALETALIPFDEGRRAPNFVEDPDADPVQLWDAATLDRLRAVKAAVDPGDVVRSNHPLS